MNVADSFHFSIDVILVTLPLAQGPEAHSAVLETELSTAVLKNLEQPLNVCSLPLAFLLIGNLAAGTTTELEAVRSGREGGNTSSQAGLGRLW